MFMSISMSMLSMSKFMSIHTAGRHTAGRHKIDTAGKHRWLAV